MATPRTPEPQEPRPLSDQEQRALTDLEQHLTVEDPALSLRLRRKGSWTGSLSSRAYNAIVQIAVVVVVLMVVLPPPGKAALVAILFMGILGTLAVHALRRERPEQ